MWVCSKCHMPRSQHGNTNYCETCWSQHAAKIQQEVVAEVEQHIEFLEEQLAGMRNYLAILQYRSKEYCDQT